MKRLSPAEREARILQLWLERPIRKRTQSDVLTFYYWLSHEEPGLVPDGAGAYNQLLKIVDGSVEPD